MKISFLGFCVIFFIHSVSAEQLTVLDDDAVNDIERVTVTATRTAALDTDLAMSVQSIGADELALDKGQHLAESLNSISGVLVDQLSGGHGHKTAIRMPMNTSGYYLFLQDNVPLQSAAFFNHNGLWWSSFNGSLARMEVLKGAGTVLYGSGAVAATVNILSEPVAKQKQTSLDIMLADEGYRKVQASHSQQFTQDNRLRVSAAHVSNDGWRDHTASRRSSINLRHEIALNANEQLVSSLIMSDLNQEMAASLTDFEQGISHSGLSADVLSHDPLRKSQYLRLSSQWSKTQEAYYYSLIPYLRYRTNDYTATWQQNMPRVISKVRSLGLLALTSISHSDSETTFGFDFELSQGNQLSYQPFDKVVTSDTYLAGEKFYHDDIGYLAISPYIQHQRSLSERLDLTIGARYDYAQYDFDNHLGVYGDIGHGKISLPDSKDYFSHISPKVSLNYHLNQDSSLYLRYANSFRLPNAGGLYHLTTKDSQTPEPVDPETSDTFELGYKLNFTRASIDIALYYMDVADGIVTAYNSDNKRYLTNAARMTHKGVEISAQWSPVEQIDLSVAYSKSQHQFDHYKAFSGNEMKMAPNYIANIRLRYMPKWLSGFSSMFELQSIGEYWLDDANSIDESTGLARKYSGYTVANIKAHYQINTKLALYGRLLNITDKVYAQEAEYRYKKNAFSPGAPKTFYFGLTYNW